jgi:hypothetical protein
MPAHGRDPVYTIVSCIAVQLDRQVSGDEFGGLAVKPRPFSDLGSPLLDVREPTLNVCRRAQASHGRPCSVGVNARSLDVTIVAGRAKPPSATAQIRVRNDVSGVASAPRAHNSTQPLQHVAE